MTHALPCLWCVCGASGTVLYIVMMELSDGGAAGGAVGATLQLLLLLAGLGLMAAVSIFV